MALARLVTERFLEQSLPASYRRPRIALAATGLPRLSIVIVNYHHWEETAALTHQILLSRAARQGAIEVIIVDNHSPPHPLCRRLRRWPSVSVRRWRHNRGFARAVNEGSRLSRGDWLLLLNPDVTLSPDFVNRVLAFLDRPPLSDPRTGIIGCHLLNSDGTRQLSSGKFPTLAGTVARLVLPRARRKYQSPPLSGPSPVPWVTGACWLLRRACLDETGGFDESFFLYYEDVDFCRRARALGWSIWYVPALRIVHHRPFHSRPITLPLRILTRHALLTYSRKHWRRWEFLTLAAIVRAEAWVKEHWASWRGNTSAASQYRDLGIIARDLMGGLVTRARRRLGRAIRLLERHGAA